MIMLAEKKDYGSAQEVQIPQTPVMSEVLDRLTDHVNRMEGLVLSIDKKVQMIYRVELVENESKLNDVADGGDCVSALRNQVDRLHRYNNYLESITDHLDRLI